MEEKKGADLELETSDGETPLDLAEVAECTPEVVALLLDRGVSHKFRRTPDKVALAFASKILSTPRKVQISTQVKEKMWSSDLGRFYE